MDRSNPASRGRVKSGQSLQDRFVYIGRSGVQVACSFVRQLRGRLHDLDDSWPKDDEERPEYFNDVLWTAEWYGGKVPVWAAHPA